MDSTTPDPLIGATLDRRYVVESRVAGGGMATVYLAHDLRLDRRLALKVMHPSLAQDPDFVRRFINEAHSVAKLSHPSVVQVFDQGEDQGTVFLAMEYVPGRTLRDVLTAMGRLGPAEAARVMGPVLSALGAAHQAGMVHRDVKPENVLLTEDGGVKVADFGLARAVESAGQGMTKTGTLMGTAAYLAPEQIERGASDARSDVYASGVMFYELLTGEQPHTGDTPIAVAYKHVNEDVPRPSRMVAGVPQAIDDLVARATERDPRYRPGDAAQFHALLLQATGGGESGPHASFAAAAAGAGAAAAAPPPPEAPPAGPPGNGAGGTAPQGPPPEAAVSHTAVVGPPPGGAGGGNDTLIVQSGGGQGGFDGYDAYDDDPGAAPLWRRKSVLAVVAGVLAVVLLGSGWWYFAGRYTEVPDIVGKDQEAAQALLADSGLKMSLADGEVYSDDADPGQVGKASPAIGEQILPGETVTLQLSKGPRTVELPDVTGEPVENARKTLEDAGFATVEEEESESRDAAPGTVLSTDPEPEEMADREGAVHLTVSAGFDVPDVTGKKQDAARSELEQAGLTVAVESKPSDDVPKGEVMSQNPGGGTTVGTGDRVTITVSSGPKEIEIPDVRGKKVGQARKQLEELGFKVKVTKILGGDRVADYNPKGKAKKGDEIELIVTPFG
ncbi:Stk1 family PASTA domain-containing Ser/Thr kinase [Nocardiopsis suaedae]|uniref:non-specific serine/threonine protein kinase n=1 Tax=Nocardiopsis suaedae TaxID=3018444 RepID=A0ABT4TPG0_9ACTN|nr:Stk1 family PASTA domain-containing Ser/Thr kinase [Nocardiopsis suaedae]MDA2806567.1 Stk1 family PASTA domain-containing Ser/Thr kinase [Nocardiopsis suaedae]